MDPTDNRPAPTGQPPDVTITPGMPRLVSTAAAAAALDVSRWTVLNLVRRGELKAKQRGRDHRAGYAFDPAELERYRRSLPTVTPTKEPQP